MHQAQAGRLGTVKSTATNTQATCLGQPDSLHHKRCDLGGRQSQAGFGQAEPGVRHRDGHIADTAKAESATQHGAFNQRDRGLWRLVDLAQHGSEGPGIVDHRIGMLGAGRLPGRGHVLDVTPCTEIAAGPAQHDSADRTILRNGIEGVAKVVQQTDRHGIASVRSVEGEMQNPRSELNQGIRGFGQSGHVDLLQPDLRLPPRPSRLLIICSMTSSAPPPIECRRRSR